MNQKFIDKIYPCVICTAVEFYSQIAPMLKRWGYTIDPQNVKSFVDCPIVQTGYASKTDLRKVGNYYKINKDKGQYLCDNILLFLEAAVKLAINQGWHTSVPAQKIDLTPAPEPMEWEPGCRISELPPRLRRLAEYRARNTQIDDLYNAFLWSSTAEGLSFWWNVFQGTAPANLEEVLATFEMRHPNSLPTKESPKVFRDSQKQDSTKALHKSSKPKSWEEFLEQQGGVPKSNELDESIEALRRLLLLREAWVDGNRDIEAFIAKGASGGLLACMMGSQDFCPIFAFPTYQMAMQFRDTFSKDLEKAFRLWDLHSED